MLVTFGEIINEVIRGLGLDSSTIETRVLESVKLRINEVQDTICFDQNWDWRSRTFYLTTRPPYSTGTVTVTQGSRTVTGSGTAWPEVVRYGYIVIDTNIYKIQSVVSSTQIKLVTAYDKETQAGASYEIVFPDEPLNHEISTIVEIRRNGIPLNVKHKSRLTLAATDKAEPTQAAMWARSDEDWYNTGTVSVTNGSDAVTGAGGTNWTEEMEGMSFRVNEFSKPYTIKTVNSTTSITLKETYDGDTGVAKGYKINPKGTQLITFRSSPDNYYVMEIEALISLPKLVNNNDISLIPNHMPLIHGATWLALSDMENKNPVRIQQAKADFEKSIKQLRDSYKIITNVQWQAEHEMNVRSRFNPLDPRRYR